MWDGDVGQDMPAAHPGPRQKAARGSLVLGSFPGSEPEPEPVLGWPVRSRAAGTGPEQARDARAAWIDRE